MIFDVKTLKIKGRNEFEKSFVSVDFNFEIDVYLISFEIMVED